MNGSMGQGNWDFDTYWQVNHGPAGRDVPVIDGERLVGVISEVDLATGHREGQRLTDQQILEFMDKMYMKA